MNYTFQTVNTKRLIRRPIRQRAPRRTRRQRLTAASLFTHVMLVAGTKVRRVERDPWVPRHLLRHSQTDVERALLERRHVRPLSGRQRVTRYLTQTGRRELTAKQARRTRQKAHRGRV